MVTGYSACASKIFNEEMENDLARHLVSLEYKFSGDAVNQCRDMVYGRAMANN